MTHPFKTILAFLFLAALSLSRPAAASVVISPGAVQLLPGGQVQFTATGSPDGVVIWSLFGAGCTGEACGQMYSSGLYIAPAVAPTPSTVTVMATSLADLSQIGTATVTIGSSGGVSVTVSPGSAVVAPKGQQQFSAVVNGSANTKVSWSVSGTGCSGAACGSVTASGIYTAPATIPSPALVKVTATSQADPTKSASASVAIQSASSITVRVSPQSVQVSTGSQQQFTASVSGTTNTGVLWSIKGCSGSCGSISSSGLYTAPATLPSTSSFSIVATSLASSSATGSASVTIVQPATLTISPGSPQIKPRGQIQFSASGPQSSIVVWSLSGNGCIGISCGTITSSGLYTAPAQAPTPATITVTATSLLNPALSGSTTITIFVPGLVSITVSPSSATVGVQSQQQFKATVTGSTNTAVVWSIKGSSCAGASCGTITTGGLYTAPAQIPNPSFVTVTATSSADSTKSSSATVTIVQAVAVGISPTSAQVSEGKTQQFTAKVTGATNTGVTWTVSGTGCSGSTCGTVSQGGLYTAPASTPNPAQVEVTATSIADSAKSASASVTIISPIMVKVTPTQANVTVTAQQQFQATVTGTSNTAVTWTVSGSGCSGGACGTISSMGLYTAPATLPNPAAVTVKATSQANTGSSASAAVTLLPSNNSRLTGQYAFFFRGFDKNGVYQAIGSITADGSGHITGGKEDVNTVAGPATDVSLSGTYDVSSDNRGTLTLRSSVGTFTYSFALNAQGSKGRFISFDQTGVRGSGTLELQSPSAFDPSALANGYVVQWTGMDGYGARVGALGLLFPDGFGFISGSSLDVNDGGSVSPTFSSFPGQYTVDSTGRGTASLLIPGLGNGSFNFALYVVSANKFLMLSIDNLQVNNLIFGGPAELQNGAPFLQSSFKGGSVFNFTGTTGSAPQQLVGRFGFDGISDAAIVYDENSGGKVSVANTSSAVYNLAQNGRGTLSFAGGTIWYMYAFGPNQAFIMDATTAAVSVGEMDPQAVFPPLSNSNALGNYLFGAGEPVVQTTPLLSGESNFDGGANIYGLGLIGGTEDLSTSSSASPNLTLAGTYSISSVSNNGRGSISLTSPGSKSIALWVVSATEMFGLDVDSTTPQPTILYFEQ